MYIFLNLDEDVQRDSWLPEFKGLINRVCDILAVLNNALIYKVLPTLNIFYEYMYM